MADAKTTADAQDALDQEIQARYGRKLKPDEWVTVTPDGDPEGGLGAFDTEEWRITLNNAAKRMKGYTVARITLADAGGVFKDALVGSVAVLTSRATPASSVIRRIALVGGAVAAGTAVVLAAAGLIKGRRRDD